MEAIVARLMPGASQATIQHVVFSIVGQILFYRYNLPLLLALLRLKAYPPAFTRRVVRHVTEFSLGGLTGLDKPRRGRRMRPPARPRVRRQRERHAP